MDGFLKDLSTTDTKKKLSLGQSMLDHLGDPETSLECEDLGALVDGLVPWMQSSNFKVTLLVIGLGIDSHRDKEQRLFLRPCFSLEICIS